MSLQETSKDEKADDNALAGEARDKAPRQSRVVGAQAASSSPMGEGGARQGVVVVDAMPLYRSGVVAALVGAGVPVVGEASRLAEGVKMAAGSHAAALLAGGVEVDEVRDAVLALPGCAVVALVTQPSRAALVEMLETGVAGLGPRSLTAEELVSTVQAAAETVGSELGDAQQEGPGTAPVFVPVLLADAAKGGGTSSPARVEADVGGASASGVPGASGADVVLTPKELEILALLRDGASNKRIAEALYVTQATVKTHLAHIYAKLGVRGRHEAISRAFALHLLR